MAQAQVTAVYFDSGACRHRLYASYVQKATCAVPVNNVHMCLCHIGTVAHFVMKNLDCIESNCATDFNLGCETTTKTVAPRILDN